MTDDSPAPAAQLRHAERPPESERMTGTELQIARVRLGMTRTDLARVLSAADNTIRRWEIGKDPVSFRARDTIRAIEAAANEAVNSLVATLREMNSPRVVISGEQGPAGQESPGLAAYGIGWWRAVAGRAVQEVPGTRVGTADELERLDAAIRAEN